MNLVLFVFICCDAIRAVFHHSRSLRERWSSRWCSRHSGTVNSSLTLRPKGWYFVIAARQASFAAESSAGSGMATARRAGLG
jgi:hypothetical protein